MTKLTFLTLVPLNIVALAVILGTVAEDATAAVGLHTAWYASRAAGFVALGSLWFGLVGGLFMSSAWFDGIAHRGRLLALHQAVTITGLALAVVHALALIPDGWTDYTAADLFVPFAAPRDRALTALGTLSLYLGVIVSGSFWFRSLIGPRMWKHIHWAGFAAFFAGWWHGIQLGTDTPATWATALYVAMGATVVTGVVVRATYRRPARRPAAREARAA